MKLQDVVLVVFLLFSTSVRSCPPANIPTFVDTSRTQLRGPVQAIVPSYNFSCYGNVTMWGACILPGGMILTDLYDIHFQVLRATPQGPEGCYDLVGSNFILRGMGGVDELRRCIVLEDIPPGDQIRVEPGDVVGFRIEHFRNGDLDDGGVQLVTDRTDVTVWYLLGVDMAPGPQVTTCRFRVGPGPELGRLVTSTNHPPVITAQVLPATLLPPPTPSLYVSPSPSTDTLLNPSQAPPQTSALSSLHLSTTSNYLSLSPPPTPSPPVTIPPDSPGSDSENLATIIVGVAGGLILLIILILIVAILTVVCFRLRSKSLQEEAELRDNPAYGAAVSTGPAVEENPAYGAAISTWPGLEKNPAYGAFELNDRDHKDPADLGEYEPVDDPQYIYVDVT